MDTTEQTTGQTSVDAGQPADEGKGTSVFAGETSGGSKGTSKQTPRTYTEEEKRQAISDALSHAGRDAESLETKEAALNAREEAIKAEEAKIEEIRRQRDVEELADAKGDPDKMAAYQAKKNREQEDTDLKAQRSAIKKEREQLDRDKAENEAEIKAAREAQMEVKLWEIGAKYGVDPVVLKELNLPTVEQAEAVAKKLSETLKRPAEGEAETLTVDSGVTSGGQGEPTHEQLEKMTVAQYAAYVAKRDAKK